MTTPDPLRATNLPPMPDTMLPAVPITEYPAGKAPTADLGAIPPLSDRRVPGAVGPPVTPRHAITSDPLIGGPPIPDDPITLTMVSDHVVDVDERLSKVNSQVQSARAWAVIGVILGVVAILLSAYLIYITNDLGNQIGALRTETVANDTERARVDNIHTTAICQAVEDMRGTFSVAGRNAYPLGPVAYDDYYNRLAASVQPLGCGTG